VSQLNLPIGPEVEIDFPGKDFAFGELIPQSVRRFGGHEGDEQESDRASYLTAQVARADRHVLRAGDARRYHSERQKDERDPRHYDGVSLQAVFGILERDVGFLDGPRGYSK
jgi:hypothetical protein